MLEAIPQLRSANETATNQVMRDDERLKQVKVRRAGSRIVDSLCGSAKRRLRLEPVGEFLFLHLPVNVLHSSVKPVYVFGSRP